MKVLLATGIYPPAIGGPATYVRALAAALAKAGHDVTVVTYGDDVVREPWAVVTVGKSGGMFARWWRYARALREQGADADVVYAFSSVSCGAPLLMAGLKKPKKLLRLGGDFFWERYTDRGGKLGLRAWYGVGIGIGLGLGLGLGRAVQKKILERLLRQFDHIVFSTRFEEELYEWVYRTLPRHSVIENPVLQGVPALHALHDPMRVLFMGRFVGFKNIPMLIASLRLLPKATLTIVGDGLMLHALHHEVERLHLSERVTFLPPAHGTAKQKIFAEHDVLVLPSITEISPNVALEARAEGLPVLLTTETGLSEKLTTGMLLKPLRTEEEIALALEDARLQYPTLSSSAASPLPAWMWDDVTKAHVQLFSAL